MRTPLTASMILLLLGASAPARAEEAVEDEPFDPCTAPQPISFKLVLPAQVPDLDVAIIKRYLKRNRPRLMYCYEKALLAKPELQGSVSLTYTIDPAGLTTGVKVSGFDADVDACIATVIDNIEFPKPKNGATVRMNHALELGRDDGTRVFDTDSTLCQALPAPLVAYATELVRAIEMPGPKGDKTFLALLPATVKVHGKKLSRARIKKAIAATGSIDGWLTLGDGEWLLAKYQGGYRLQRGYGSTATGLYTAEGNGTLEEPASVLRFKKVKGAWRLVEVVSE